MHRQNAIMAWDVELVHLPFRLAVSGWTLPAEVQEHRLPRRVHIIDHSAWFVGLFHQVGLDYRVGANMIRVFGYSPRNMDLFDQF